MSSGSSITADEPELPYPRVQYFDPISPKEWNITDALRDHRQRNPDRTLHDCYFDVIKTLKRIVSDSPINAQVKRAASLINEDGEAESSKHNIPNGNIINHGKIDCVTQNNYM